MPDEYMSSAEFAALSSREQLAVWGAVERGLVAWVPAGNMRRYHRAQVEALLEPAATGAGNG